MITLNIVLAFAIVALQSQGAGAVQHVQQKTIVDCMLMPKGAPRLQQPNLSVLLPGTLGEVIVGRPVMLSDDAHPILIKDPGKLLEDLPVISVNHFKPETISLVTGAPNDENRKLITLRLNSSGKWYDAGLGRLGGGEPTLFGACFLTIAADAEAEFLANPPKAPN